MSASTFITQNNLNTNADDIALYNARKASKSIKDGMKIYEQRNISRVIPENRPFIIRLNVNGNPLNKMNQFINQSYPDNYFDKSYYLSMINTARSLMNDKMFKPRFVYTIADEINLLFNSADIFEGSVQKYLTLLSSKATSYFRNHFVQYIPSDKMQCYDPATIKNIKNNIPVFEGCILFFPEDKKYEIVNYFIWRSGKRNPVDEFYRSKEGKAFIMHKTNQNLIEKFKDNNKFSIEQILPTYTKYGVFMKKSIHSACCFNNDGLNDENVTYLVDNIWSMDFKFGNDVLDEMLAKYYNTDKWDIISEKPTTNFWFTYNLNTFDIKTHPNGETTESEDEEFETHVSEQNKVRSHVFKYKNPYANDKCPEFYSIIPGMTLALILLNTYQILSDSSSQTQLLTMVHMGFIYATILTSINYKTLRIITWLWRFWLLAFTTINIPVVYTTAIKNSYLRIGYVCLIVYSYYLTLFSGIYLFSIHKEKQQKSQILNSYILTQDQKIQDDDEESIVELEDEKEESTPTESTTENIAETTNVEAQKTENVSSTTTTEHEHQD
jgi:tRNA(His) 5'-end guanylyltransferase